MDLNLTKNNEAGALSIELVFIVIMLVLVGIYIFGQLDIQAGNVSGGLSTATDDLPTVADGA